jgi:hypothetical protein
MYLASDATAGQSSLGNPKIERNLFCEKSDVSRKVVTTAHDSPEVRTSINPPASIRGKPILLPVYVVNFSATAGEVSRPLLVIFAVIA